MAEVQPKQLLQQELAHLEQTSSHGLEGELAVRANAYQLMRTIEALFIYLAEFSAEEDHASAEGIIEHLQEQGTIDDDIASALSELSDVNQYFLDVAHVDMDFVAEIIAYTQTYMQAIKVVFEKLQDTNSITQQVEDDGKGSTEE